MLIGISFQGAARLLRGDFGMRPGSRRRLESDFSKRTSPWCFIAQQVLKTTSWCVGRSPANDFTIQVAVPIPANTMKCTMEVWHSFIHGSLPLWFFSLAPLDGRNCQTGTCVQSGGTSRAPGNGCEWHAGGMWCGLRVGSHQGSEMGKDGVF